jgi:hypothetical protein
MIIALYQNFKSVFDLDSIQVKLLDSIALDSNCIPGIFARNMLVFNEHLAYEEPYLLPDTSLKNGTIKIPIIAEESFPPEFKVYPNPAGAYLTIEYNLLDEACDGYIIIRDNIGKTIRTHQLSLNKHSLLISTSELSNGVYYLSLHCNNNSVATEKVIIQH